MKAKAEQVFDLNAFRAEQPGALERDVAGLVERRRKSFGEVPVSIGLPSHFLKPSLKND